MVGKTANPQKGTPPGPRPEAALGGLSVDWLLGHTVDPLARGILLRFDLQPALAAEDADEAPDRVLLPTGEFLNLGQARALGPLHQGDYLGLLVALARSAL